MNIEGVNKLFSAMQDINVAQMKIHEVSNSGLGFDLSKPLNILYKELDASRQLLLVYLGRIKSSDINLDIAEPQSIKAYKNLNEEVTNEPS